MSNEKIEVGDVVRWEIDGNEYVVEKVQTFTNEVVTLNVVGGVCREVVQLVRKADPYHGLTLPEPPAGYRLAKWGEEYDERAGWVHCHQHHRRIQVGDQNEESIHLLLLGRKSPW